MPTSCTTIAFDNFCAVAFSINDTPLSTCFQQQMSPISPSNHPHPTAPSKHRPSRRKKKLNSPSFFILAFAAIVVVICLGGYLQTRDTNVLSIAASTLTFLLGYGVPKE